MDTKTLQELIAVLETDLPGLQARHPGTFAFASIWAQRYESILAQTPEPMRPAVEKQLLRIGIRWGVMPGARVTCQFPALTISPRLQRHFA